jgi:SNF2 family DNA or RNA helicase
VAFADVVTERPDEIVVQASWAEKDTIKMVPGTRWDGPAKVWRLPFSWGACVMLRGLLAKNLTIGSNLNRRVWAEREERIDRAISMRSRTEPLGTYEGSKLYPFQQAGVEWLLVAGDAILGDDLGVGKTIQLITALAEDIQAYDTQGHSLDVRNPLPAVVVCPNGVKKHWREQLAEHLPQVETFTYTGTPVARARALKAWQECGSGILIVNFESLRSLSRLAPFGSTALKACRDCRSNGEVGLPATRCEVHPKALNTTVVRTYIVDEIHRAKSPESKVTRALWAAAHSPHVTRRWGATGTPMANDPSDVWSLMHAIAPLDYPTRSEFVDRYCMAQWSPYGNLKIVGVQPEHKEEFFRILDTRFRRMPKGLVLDMLPPIVRVSRMVTLPPKMAKHYRELRDQMITDLGGDAGLLIAPSSLSRQRRLLQLSSSMCEVETNGEPDPRDWKVRLVEPSPKIDELELILEELGDRQVTVVAESRQLIEMAARRLQRNGVTHGLITGAQNEWERGVALEAFQAAKTRVLLYTIQAGSTGLTMTAADTQIYLQRSYHMIHSIQADGRIHRIGSERHESVTYIDLVAEGTEEEDQITAMMEKYQRMEEITRDIETLTAAGKSTAELEHKLYGIQNSHVGQRV